MKHNTHLSKKTPYQYTATDGQKFSTKADKEYYQEQQMEKKQLQQEDAYRDDLDRTPLWLFPNKDGEWEC